MTQVGKWMEPVALQGQGDSGGRTSGGSDTIDTEHSSDFTLADPLKYFVGEYM